MQAFSGRFSYYLCTWYLLALSLFFINSCAFTTQAKYKIVGSYSLPSGLPESSALFCAKDEGVYTVNDSGNPPVIFHLDENAKVVSTIEPINVKNWDWEALSADGNFFYVGDIGNNRGNRKSVLIYKIPRGSKAPIKATKLVLKYEENNPKENETLNHDYDAEALVAVDKHLVLFSKSWKTDILKIYFVDKNKKKQNLSVQKTVEGISGVITGADYDKITQQYVLVGYPSTRIGFGNPFLVILDRHFTLLETITLSGFGQVEGVCAHHTGQIWFTQEASILSNSKLIKLKLN